MNLIEMKTNDAIQARVCGWISDNYQGICEYAARTCYHKEADAKEGSWKRYLHARVKSGHESVIEHNSVAIMFQVDPMMKNILMQLAAYVSKNNNLLRTIFNYEGNSVIICGNLRSFRDFIKNATDALEWDRHAYTLADIWYYYIYAAFVFLTNDDYIENEDGSKTNIFTENLKMKSRQFTWTMIDADGTEPTALHTEDIPVVHEDNGITLAIIGNDTVADLRDLLVSKWGFEKAERNEFENQCLNNAIMNMGRISYRVKIPRIISQQDTRHRIGAISQQSQRYVNAANAEFYYPVPKDTEVVCGDNYMDIEDFYSFTIRAYDNMLDQGFNKEDARFLLPGGIMTEYVMTKPFYTLPHYFYERTSIAAQMEIRSIAVALQNYVDENIVSKDCNIDFHHGR